MHSTRTWYREERQTLGHLRIGIWLGDPVFLHIAILFKGQKCSKFPLERSASWPHPREGVYYEKKNAPRAEKLAKLGSEFFKVKPSEPSSRLRHASANLRAYISYFYNQ